MRVNKAKRRLLRWHRYLKATGSEVTFNKTWSTAGFHQGHAKAYWNVHYANRYAPKGIRTPWAPTLWRPGT